MTFNSLFVEISYDDDDFSQNETTPKKKEKTLRNKVSIKNRAKFKDLIANQPKGPGS